MEDLKLPKSFSHFRRFPMDGALLLFDRDTGMNVLCEGEETGKMTQLAPRVVQFGITNVCNLACTFCSRDVQAQSKWTACEVFNLLASLAEKGLLEVAFGGGEPLLFPGFEDLVSRLYEETELAVNFTTNGLALTEDKLKVLKGKYGQIRLSLYDNNNWKEKIQMLAKSNSRFGINYLVTPQRLETVTKTILEISSLGCKDILLLSYNGGDRSLHLNSEEVARLSSSIKVVSQSLEGRCQVKLDVCWGERMQNVPQLFQKADCGAGYDFLVITSEKKIQPCSFHDLTIEIRNADDVMAVWGNRQNELSKAASLPGCARAFNYGF